MGKLTAFIFLVVMALAAIGGYVANIIKLCHLPGIEGHMGEVVVRVIGIFTGVVGAVAGYF